MSTKTWQAESQLASLLREENIAESRPITPPCRNVVGGPVSNGLVVLPPENNNVQFNLQSTTITETNKRHGSADRIQRKLHSVERSNGGRLVPDKIVDYPTGVQEECKKLKAVQTELKTSQPSLEKAIATPKNISNLISNEENSKKSVDVNSSLDKLHVSQDLPIELKAEFLSCVMEKNYEKALHLCTEMLAVNPENETCVEFQTVIKEKILQVTIPTPDLFPSFTNSGFPLTYLNATLFHDNILDGSHTDMNATLSDEESEEDETGTDDSDDDSSDDDDDDESGDSDEEDGDESEEDDDESSDDDDREDESESSSDSDIEIPSGPINLLMGGLPLRSFSELPESKSDNT